MEMILFLRMNHGLLMRCESIVCSLENGVAE